MPSLTQLTHRTLGRRIALVDGNKLSLLEPYTTVYEMAQVAIVHNVGLADLAEQSRGSQTLDYNKVYQGKSPWKLLPSFDHPTQPGCCMVSGTGLTHLASAKNRDAMHAKAKAPKKAPELSDSMKMYQWGVEGGRPKAGAIGVQPEWFYKGSGSILRGHGQPLEILAFADDGGDEGEVAAVYLIGPKGQPLRVGFTVGNEFSDHIMEKKNYLYLAPSKLRNCALGPELVLDATFDDIRGQARVERNGKPIWSRDIATGEANMSHTLANLEHHQFKYPGHRQPGDVHVHFFGAAAFSFGEGLALRDDDVMVIDFPRFGRALRNPVKIDSRKQPLVSVKPL